MAAQPAPSRTVLFRIAWAVAPFWLCAVWMAPTPAAAEDLSFRDFPFLVYCQIKGIDKGFYFSRLNDDGVAIYLSPDRQAGMVTIDGVARSIGGEQTGSCANKTLDDLKDSGQAYYLPK